MILPGNLNDVVPARCNVDDEAIFANVKANVALGLPFLVVSDAHDGVAVIVGGGPSMKASLPAIALHYKHGHSVFAVNGTTPALSSVDVTPDHFVLLDARPDNQTFLGDARHYLIASQCDPVIFRALTGKTVTIWHPNFPGITDYTGGNGAALIGGGTTVGLQALSIAYAMGYRTIHLYGFDSSYSDGEGHAYSQDINRADRVETVYVGGQEFKAAPWMVRQAVEFQTNVSQLIDGGCKVYVHGSGLLPTVAKMMANPPETLDAVYDLSACPASWDFVTWLASAEMTRARHGFKHLNVSFLKGPNEGFRDDDLPDSLDHRRSILGNVIRPALEMIGAKEGVALHGWRGGYMAADIARAFRDGEAVPKYKAPEWARKVVSERLRGRRPVVITLREADHWPGRNSDLQAWLKFAATLDDVIFVRDAAKAFMPLPVPFETFPSASKFSDIRMALYEAALVNMGSSNGPMMMLALSDCPYMIFKMLAPDYVAGTQEWLENNVGVKVGENFAWAAPDQRIVWEPDTFEAISSAYRDFIDFQETNLLALAS